MARNKKSYNYNYNVRRSRKRRRWTVEVLAVLFALLLVLCAYAGKFNPESFFFAPFLTLAYMPMLLLLALLLVVLLFCRKWLAMAVLILGFVVTLPVFRLFVPMNSEDA